jgi:2-(1,2-epoxy-1,2-dihydrophenyl)acetyl-CoA isomerase
VNPYDPPVADENEDLLYEVRDGVAWITFNRPDVGNSVTPDQRNRLIDHLEAINGDLGVRCVVLTATGKHFCTGADLRADRRGGPDQPEGAPERPVGAAKRMITYGAQRLISAILDCEKPVIVGLNGTAAGLGAHLTLAADLVIAAEGIKIIEVFVRRGIIPDAGGPYLLTRAVGMHKAKELAFFGDDLLAEDALALGIVNRVVPGDQLQAALEEWAGRLAQGPTRAIATTKWLINRAVDQDRATAFGEEAMAQEHVMHTEDMGEGVAAFIERRDPKFKGW